ncbi:MAG TPA: Mth938-like domain-containing protein [Casimicrobiaceae bacterium]|nr:Mth938-like domain-containing protein [Casimicrobiaceae bacterium]
MKFHLSTSDGNVFTGHGADYVRLGVIEYRENLLVTPERIVTAWAPGGFEALSEGDFAAIAALEPEVALLGTGASLRFPNPRLTRPLIDAGIGLEVMDTPAACRTFNILAAEGRKVVAAVLVEAR